MLLNLASDKPFVYFNNDFLFFDRKSLESILPSFFYKNKDIIKTIYIINWPWYFSSTRVGVEVVNILYALGIIKDIYFLDKLDFFQQNNIVDTYLFSGNKNKFIYLEKNGSYKIVWKKELNFSKNFEELFELKLDNINFVKYTDFIKNYKNLNWKKLWKQSLLKPNYIFEPIVC